LPYSSPSHDKVSIELCAGQALNTAFSLNDCGTNSKNNNSRDLYSGINQCKRGYQPRSNFVRDESGHLLADSHNILNRWKNYSQLLNVHSASDVRQIEIHTVQPLLPGPSHLRS
jgi:hypothetical protein